MLPRIVSNCCAPVVADLLWNVRDLWHSGVGRTRTIYRFQIRTAQIHREALLIEDFNVQCS